MEHSILMAGQTLETEDIYTKLTEGTNIIWFGNRSDNEALKNDIRFKIFIENHFLSIYKLNNKVCLKIINGSEIKRYKKELELLENGDKNFNLKQYIIEHDDEHNFIVVKAGAGSGKTFIMSNRLLFLLHTKENLHLKDVVMITFTNKATDSMRHKFIDLLRRKLFVVKNIEIKKKYLSWIEEVPQMTISTIHSFFKKIVLEIGPMLGYGTNLKLTSMIFEKRKILRDIMDRKYTDNNGEVRGVLGLPIHDIERLAEGFWKKINRNGMTGHEVAAMDWGTAGSEQARNIQDTLVGLFKEVEKEYDLKKLESNSIEMNDITHEFNRVRNDTSLKEYITHHYKHIFCDEFQDSDDIQIQTIVALAKLYGGTLFVVGDVKQSIYRFRGATDSAFDRLDDNIKKVFGEDGFTKNLQKYSLSKNYRSSKDILDDIDPIFRKWNDDGCLQYSYTGNDSDVLTPLQTGKGIYKQIPVFGRDSIRTNFIKLINKIENNSGASITVLTRDNKQLQYIADWCNEMKRACLIKEKGTFFTSVAVKEFCVFIEALQYYTEPMYLYNFLRSAYGSYKKVNLKEIQKYDGHKETLVEYFNDLIDEEYNWEDLKLELRNKPVMAVIFKVISDKRPSIVYGARQKSHYLKSGYSVKEAIKQSVLDAKQYEADLQKLFQKISDRFSDEFFSLCDLCNYLRIKISTDSEEDQADITDVQEISSIVGYTVHKAKGLEFDYVILPFTDKCFRLDYLSEILVDKNTREVGWKYYDSRSQNTVCNELYDKLEETEIEEVRGDETRLLYVAMTRAIKGLYCFTSRKQHSGEIWADLLPEDRDDENYL